MKISFSTVPGNLMTNTGYGYAGFHMVRSLQELGHTVPFQDSSAPVQIHFSFPEWYQFYPGQYKIGYTPWESSELKPGWLDHMNNCDEVWTTNDLCAQWFDAAGVNRPLYVYEHGIDPSWTKKPRVVEDKIHFFHHGEPAPRKGGQMALDAFLAAFGNRDDVHLTIKAHKYNTIRVKDRKGSIVNLPEKLNNVSVIIDDLSQEKLVQLYHQQHVMIYPSFGEGFGFIPLQAAATGMPVVVPHEWASFREYLLPELRLAARIGKTIWPEMHPGDMFHPQFDHLVDLLRYAADNFDFLSRRSYAKAQKIKEKYNWISLTKNAFAHVIDGPSSLY